MTTLSKIFLSFILLIGILGGTYFVYDKVNWTYQGPDKQFIISEGEGFARVNSNLAKAQLISSSRVFHYISKFYNKVDKLQQGSFTIKEGTSMFQLLDLLTSPPALISITIPEGKNIFEIAELLEKKDITKKSLFLDAASDPELIGLTFNKRSQNVEGYLFPDTYKLSKSMDPKKIIRLMIENFLSKIEGIDFTLSKLSKEEIIILSSIVEKETGASFERPIIAGVFFNRLNQGMKLQSDPTTIYGMWEKFDGNIHKKDLRDDSLYNTYVIKALPVGPICNPGLHALQAVLNPQTHDYLFFVSKNDGTHIFSKSYRDHDRAVSTWQRTKSNREGRSWRMLKEASNAKPKKVH